MPQVLEKLTDGYRTVLRGEFGDVMAHILVQIQFPGLHQLHCRQGGQRLGHRHVGG